MTRTRRDDDAYGQVDVALMDRTPAAVQLIESNSRLRAWIPRTLLSYSAEEFLNSIEPRGKMQTPGPDDFDSVEIKLWKLRDIGWA